MDIEPPSFFENIQVGLFFALTGIMFLTFFSAFISGAGMSLFSLSQKDLVDVLEKNSKKGTLIKNLLTQPKRLSFTFFILSFFTNTAIVVLFFFIKDFLFSGISVYWIRWIVEVSSVVLIIVLFGDVLPKVYANRNNVRISLFSISFISFLYKLLSPLSIPMQKLFVYLQKKIGEQKQDFSVSHLSQALELTSTEDTSDDEQRLFEGIVAFGNTEASQIMSPRIDVFAIEKNDSFQDILSEISEKGYSRIPIYDDNIDNIVGVLYVKDLLPHLDKKDFDWNTLLRNPFFVPENKKLDDLLKEFQNMKNHLAVVVDEYGGTSGVITLEDIIEEIVGDISDEFDDENINYSQIDDQTFLFEGKINLKDFYRIINDAEESLEVYNGEAETLAGLILEILGSFPKIGQKISYGNSLFVIEAVDKKRIKQIKVIINV